MVGLGLTIKNSGLYPNC